MKILISLAALSLASASVIPLQARSPANAPFSVEATSDYSKSLETDYDHSKRAAEIDSDYDYENDKRAAEASSDYDNGKRTSSDYSDATEYDKREDSDYNLGDHVKRAIEKKRGAAGEDTDYGKSAGSDYDTDYKKRTGKAEGDYEGDYSV